MNQQINEWFGLHVLHWHSYVGCVISFRLTFGTHTGISLGYSPHSLLLCHHWRSWVTTIEQYENRTDYPAPNNMDYITHIWLHGVYHSCLTLCVCSYSTTLGFCFVNICGLLDIKHSHSGVFPRVSLWFWSARAARPLRLPLTFFLAYNCLF